MRSNSWKQNTLRWLDRDILPMLGDRPVAEIEAVEVLVLMEEGERRVSASHANDLRGLVTMILDHAIARGAARHNVATALRRAIPKPPSKPHPHLTEEQLGEFLRADVEALTPSVLYAIKRLPHLALRVAELCRLEAADVDLKLGVIRIPAPRMKGRHEHIVPLSRQATKLVREAMQLRGPSAYLFPGLSARDQPISKTAINRAIERMELPFPIVPHSFRSTFATITRERDLGSHDAIELALAHRLGGRSRLGLQPGDAAATKAGVGAEVERFAGAIGTEQIGTPGPTCISPCSWAGRGSSRTLASRTPRGRGLARPTTRLGNPTR
jgi:integrase